LDNVNCIVIGGGVVGLAIARQLCFTNNSCIVVDAKDSYGQGVSSRNSEVIHGGLYYPSHTLKAEFCVKGKELLYQYCSDRNISYRKCGKIIVATSADEEEGLFNILSSAEANGVEDLVRLSKRKINSLEPNVSSVSGLLSPSTGIIDSHGFMTSLVADIEVLGGSFIPNSPVTKIVYNGSTYDVFFSISGLEYRIQSRFVINAAGLSAQNIAYNIQDFPDASVPKLYLCKGTYFALSGNKPFKRLIYPVPPKRGDGLGVHATLDLNGNVRFGPDVEYIDDENYAVSDDQVDEFYKAISRYYPGIDKSRLYADYCGLRPKLQGPKDGFKDFDVQDGSQYGFPGLIQLFGIESPGLTSSLSISKYVESLLTDL
jgi:L-2-hydroxyglutarate oxidase LhgO